VPRGVERGVLAACSDDDRAQAREVQAKEWII
jgi:hypothetical protein